MPVIINEFDVIAEPAPQQQSNGSLPENEQPPMHPADIDQIVRVMQERRSRVHAD